MSERVVDEAGAQEAAVEESAEALTLDETSSAEDAGVTEVLPAESENLTPDPQALGLELPEDKEEAIGLLLTEVDKARSDASSYLDDLKRVAADFDNYRKRTIRDQAGLHGRAAEKVIQGLLPALDSFDAALTIEPTSETEEKMASGMVNTRTQLLATLETEGLQLIPTVGEAFDPEVHEPVGAPTDPGELVVSQELRRGYMLNGKVVRAALVALEIKQ